MSPCLLQSRFFAHVQIGRRRCPPLSGSDCPSVLPSIFSFEYDGDDAEAADTGSEQAQEDVGRRDEPKGKNVDRLVAVVGVLAVLLVHLWLVDPIDPDTA